MKYDLFFKTSKITGGLLFCLALLIGGFSQEVRAQRLTEVGSKTLGLGFGFGYNYYSGNYSSGNLKYQTSIPYFLRAHLDIGVAELGSTVLTIGPMIGFGQTVRRWTYNDGSNYRWIWTNVVIAARGAIHYDFDVPRLDCYGGLSVGPRIQTYREVWDDGRPDGYNDNNQWRSTQTYLSAAGFLGMAYGLSDNVSLFGELGFGYSWFTAGVQFKL